MKEQQVKEPIFDLTTYEGIEVWRRWYMIEFAIQKVSGPREKAETPHPKEKQEEID